uniref:(northern house mosquito) hypothetical protein n=2 Tax=Culex pipiens TaxID=7175 RepID=A0A8D8E4U6_CULPI
MLGTKYSFHCCSGQSLIRWSCFMECTPAVASCAELDFHPSIRMLSPNGIHNFDICSIITPVIRLPLETVVGTRLTHTNTHEGTRLDLSINLGLLNARQIHSQIGHSQWCTVRYRITVWKKSDVVMSFGLFKSKTLFFFIHFYQSIIIFFFNVFLYPIRYVAPNAFNFNRF